MNTGVIILNSKYLIKRLQTTDLDYRLQLIAKTIYDSRESNLLYEKTDRYPN